MNDPRKDRPKWEVLLSTSALRQKKKLPQAIANIFARLLSDLERSGPVQAGWTNYGKLKKDKRIPDNSYHCHIKSGKPTYVACWKVVGKTIKVMEVFYVGSHENAPY